MLFVSQSWPYDFLHEVCHSFTIAPPCHSHRMQGLSPEHLDSSQPLLIGTPEGSPWQSEVTVVTTPQVEWTDSLEHFQITNTREEFRLHPDSERFFTWANSSGDLIVVYSGSTSGPGDQDPFWSKDVFWRDLLVQVHLWFLKSTHLWFSKSLV